MLFKRQASGIPNRKRPARRTLNVLGIKQAIVFVVGTATAVGSGLTGLGAQAAIGPMLTWMLGFSRERARANATLFACVAAAAAVLVAYMHHATSDTLVLRGIILFVGAVAGALVCSTVSRNILSLQWMRISQTIGVGIALVIVMYTARLGRFDTAHIVEWRLIWQLGGMAFIVGAATQILSLPSGMLMVPVLYFFGGFTPSEAVSLSLFVVACASFPPSLGYIRNGIADGGYAVPMLAAAVLGGVLGGLLLPVVRSVDPNSEQIAYKALVISSAVISMFLCARQLALLSLRIGHSDETTALDEATCPADKER